MGQKVNVMWTEYPAHDAEPEGKAVKQAFIQKDRGDLSGGWTVLGGDPQALVMAVDTNDIEMRYA